MEDSSLAASAEKATLMAMGVCKRVPFYIFAVMIIITVLLSSYIGLLIFLYSSMLVIFTYIVTMLSYITVGGSSKLSLAQGICWCVFSVPIVDVLLTINWRIISGYFSKIWQVLSFQGILNYLNYQMSTSRNRCWARLKLLITAVIILCVLAGLIWSFMSEGTTSFTQSGFIIGIYSVLAPTIAVMKAFYYAWRVIFCVDNHSDEYGFVGDDDDELEDMERTPRKKTEEEKAGRLSLFDPCQLLSHGLWRKFANSECNYMYVFKKTGKCSWTLLPAILAGLFQAAFVAFDWLAFVKTLQTLKKLGEPISWFVYVGPSLRTVLAIYSLPLVMSANVTVLFTKWKCLGKRIARIKIVTVVFYILVFILFGVYAGFMSHLWKPYVLTEFSYQEHPEKSINASLTAPVCSNSIGGWSLLELSALSLIPSTRPSDDFVRNVTSTLLGEDVIQGSGCGVQTLMSYCAFSKNNSASVLAYGSMTEKVHLSVMLESVLGYWFSKGVSAIVPFYSVTYSLFLQKILDPVAVFLGDLSLGMQSLSANMQNDVTEMVKQWESASTVPVFTGHMPGGLAAKYASALSMEMDSPAYSVAFEAPTLSTSKMAQQTLGLSGNKGSYYMYNLYSDTSLFSFAETNLTANVKMPTSQSIFKTANVYETFCLLAAACAETDRYDRFCVHTVGREKYEKYFEGWSRTRDPIDI